MQKRYGDQAPAYVAERIGALATASDAAGVERFMQIAERLAKLRGNRVGTSSRD